MLASNQRRLGNQRRDCERSRERRGRAAGMRRFLTSALRRNSCGAANREALERSRSALCCRLPPLLKVLARGCPPQCVITKTVGRHKGMVLHMRHCAARRPASFLNIKLHHGEGFSASLRCRSCLSCSHSQTLLDITNRHDNVVEKQSIVTTRGGVIYPEPQPRGWGGFLLCLGAERRHGA